MKNLYIFSPGDFKGTEGKWQSGRWAKISWLDSRDNKTIVPFKEGKEICVELTPGTEVLYEKGWEHIVDVSKVHIADPINRYHSF